MAVAMLETLSHATTIISNFVSTKVGLSLTAATTVTGLGLIPRLGPGRAVALGLRSWAIGPKTKSQRQTEVEELRGNMSSVAMLEAGQFCVVTGPIGVGKTCIVGTATSRTFGVVHVPVSAGASTKEIKLDALLRINRSRLPFYSQHYDAKRVLWIHRLLFRVPPTIVLQAAERGATDGYSQIQAACRELAAMGFRVIVDASHNSLPEDAVATNRELELAVEPMSRETVESLPKVADLVAALRAAGLADIVWEVVGGNPSVYLQLAAKWLATPRREITSVVEQFLLMKLLRTAIDDRSAALVRNKRLAELYKHFTSNDVVPSSVLVDLDLERSSPDKVLRKVGIGMNTFLVPSTQAMAVVLRHALAEVPPSLDALKAVLSKEKAE